MRVSGDPSDRYPGGGRPGRGPPRLPAPDSIADAKKDLAGIKASRASRSRASPFRRST